MEAGATDTPGGTSVTGRRLTAKGAAMRDRIIRTAAHEVLVRGVGGTSLDEIGTLTSTSRSQFFHYFPDGKRDLVRAIVDYNGNRVLDAQRPALDELDTWASWAAWRDAVVDHYAREDGVHGCPIGSMAAEVAQTDEVLRDDLVAYFRQWERLVADGVRRMQAAGLLPPDVDPARVGTEFMAAIQGGLLLAQMEGSLAPLEIALDAALDHLRARARDAERV